MHGHVRNEAMLLVLGSHALRFNLDHAVGDHLYQFNDRLTQRHKLHNFMFEASTIGPQPLPQVLQVADERVNFTARSFRASFS